MTAGKNINRTLTTRYQVTGNNVTNACPSTTNNNKAKKGAGSERLAAPSARKTCGPRSRAWLQHESSSRWNVTVSLDRRCRLQLAAATHKPPSDQTPDRIRGPAHVHAGRPAHDLHDLTCNGPQPGAIAAGRMRCCWRARLAPASSGHLAVWTLVHQPDWRSSNVHVILPAAAGPVCSQSCKLRQSCVQPHDWSKQTKFPPTFPPGSLPLGTGAV